MLKFDNAEEYEQDSQLIELMATCSALVAKLKLANDIRRTKRISLHIHTLQKQIKDLKELIGMRESKNQLHDWLGENK